MSPDGDAKLMRTGLGLLLGLAPLLLAALGLAALRPPPPRPPLGPRTLVLFDGAEERAADYAGLAAIDAPRLTVPLDFAVLPFDEVHLSAAMRHEGDALRAAGFTAVAEGVWRRSPGRGGECP